MLNLSWPRLSGPPSIKTRDLSPLPMKTERSVTAFTSRICNLVWFKAFISWDLSHKTVRNPDSTYRRPVWMLRSNPAPQRFCMILTPGTIGRQILNIRALKQDTHENPCNSQTCDDYNKLGSREVITQQYNYNHLEIVANVYLEAVL